MDNIYIQLLLAVLCAAVIAFASTPIIRVLAYKLGAVDIPKDGRRMHKKPMPLLGGLAIFVAFSLTSLIFFLYTPQFLTIWFGGLVIIICGILDDIFSLNPFVKLGGQVLAALIVISQGIVIEHINIFGTYIQFGWFSIPITLIWIVGLTNAINLIDGLDGLACGVSAICATSLLVVSILHADASIMMITAILVGSCIGFLPFNSNPAKIFMGDTGAMFLGYTLSVGSVVGVFKFTAVVSFVIPIIIFGLPLFDTLLAILRRVIHGKSPFSADRGHLHHKLVDMGLNQKQSVTILYAVCSILGILAIMLSEDKIVSSIIILCVAVVIGIINYVFFNSKKTRDFTGLTDEKNKTEADVAANAESKASVSTPNVEVSSKNDTNVKEDHIKK